MYFNNPVIKTMKEIEVYAIAREKESKILGITFDAADFINKVEHTRLTTHMNLEEAFEYERKKTIGYIPTTDRS